MDKQPVLETLASVLKTRKEQIMDTKERLAKSLMEEVITHFEIPIQISDHVDKYDLINEVHRILLDYKFNKQQVLDITELMFEEFLNEIECDNFGECYQDFVGYYLTEYVAEYMMEKVSTQE